MTNPDTIAAIVTAPGEAGVSIIRVSGPQSHPLADQLFRCSPPLPSQRNGYTCVYGHILDGDDIIDEGLLLLFRKPRSYTAEDVVEFHCHGGGASAQRVLRACLNAGARPSDPGEFTRRAFLNGRIDLIQAEAVMDLVRSHSERSQAAAVQQLEGKLSSKINQVYEGLMQVAAQLEATLDFPEDELPASVIPTIQQQIESTLLDMDTLLSTWSEGHILRDGVLVVLSGKPNVGKSTLLNCLLGHERAIVSDIPGTTRDSIEEEFNLGGFPMRLVDTAGLREATDEIEKIGIQRTRGYLEKADLHLHIIDLSQPADDQSRENLQELIPGKSILICNKTDLSRMFHVEQWPEAIPRVETSLAHDIGYEDLKSAMLKMLSGSIDLSARPHAVISERHREAISTAKQDLLGVKELLAAEDVEESLVMAIPALRDSLTRLGEVTGREYHEELLDQVFSTFCIGK
jgi:tRNA modification GTPase